MLCFIIFIGSCLLPECVQAALINKETEETMAQPMV